MVLVIVPVVVEALVNPGPIALVALMVLLVILGQVALKAARVLVEMRRIESVAVNM